MEELVIDESTLTTYTYHILHSNKANNLIIKSNSCNTYDILYDTLSTIPKDVINIINDYNKINISLMCSIDNTKYNDTRRTLRTDFTKMIFNDKQYMLDIAIIILINPKLVINDYTLMIPTKKIHRTTILIQKTNISNRRYLLPNDFNTKYPDISNELTNILNKLIAKSYQQLF